MIFEQIMRKFKAFNEDDQPPPEDPVLGIGIKGFISKLRSLRLEWGTGATMILAPEGLDESHYRSIKKYNVNTPGDVCFTFGRSKDHIPGDVEWHPKLCDILALLIRERYNTIDEKFEDKTIWIRNQEAGESIVGFVVDVTYIIGEHNAIVVVWRSLGS